MINKAIKDKPHPTSGSKSDYMYQGIKLALIDTSIGGCFYHSIFNCIDMDYIVLENNEQRCKYVQDKKIELIQFLKDNFSVLGEGFFSEVDNEEYSFETIQHEILSGVNVGYELIPLFELYFSINIYVIDIAGNKPLKLCKEDKENSDCIILGYMNNHFVSVGKCEGQEYITSFSYENNLIPLVK